MSKLREWFVPLAYFSNNLISRIGIFVVTAAGVLWVLLLPQLLRGSMSNPYAGIILYMGLPTLFLGGLVLIPVGVYLERRRSKSAGETQPVVFDFRHPAVRKLAIFLGLATLANIVIASQLSYTAITYMDNEKFCGETCHTVMTPEHTAYLQSPHSRVSCVECHIGPGAGWFVRYKLDGVGQLFAVIAHSYPRPIPSPVANLRPARETCEQCHSPQRFTDDRFVVHTEYAVDEHNTPATTVLLMKIGGQTWKGTVGIHGAHLEANTKIDYITTDRQRQIIPQVIYTDAAGKTTTYNDTSTKLTPQQLTAGEHRTMDCMDCHNRPTHIFQVPERAVDQAMADGHISPALPFAKKQALETLKRDYPDRETAERDIAGGFNEYYRKNYPEIYASNKGAVDAAITAVQAIYARNIFPDMKITWGTYPSNLGHTDSPGCFRCHDGNHSSADGKTIPNDCSTCHDMPAMQERNPKILSDLGFKPPAGSVPDSK
jgi:hypothetical protein